MLYGANVHGEVVLQQIHLAFIACVIAILVLPLNSDSCDEIGIIACPNGAAYFPDTLRLLPPDYVKNEWDSDAPIVSVFLRLMATCLWGGQGRLWARFRSELGDGETTTLGV